MQGSFLPHVTPTLTLTLAITRTRTRTRIRTRTLTPTLTLTPALALTRALRHDESQPAAEPGGPRRPGAAGARRGHTL